MHVHRVFESLCLLYTGEANIDNDLPPIPLEIALRFDIVITRTHSIRHQNSLGANFICAYYALIMHHSVK